MSKKGVLIVRPLPEPEDLQPADKPWTRREKIQGALLLGLPIAIACSYLLWLLAYTIRLVMVQG